MIGSRRESAGRANKPIPSGVPAARPMALVLLAALLTPATAAAQARDTGPAAAQDSSRATARASRSLPLSAARSMEFTVTEGSWISVDVSPDGKTIVFDLLGDLYTLPIEGGQATRLTSGMAYDAQPRFSPDGEKIVFVSDRSGGENLWILTLSDGSMRALTTGDDDMYTSPEWTPDGQYVVASKTYSPLGGSAKLWLYHVDGGSGAQLIRGPQDLKTLGAAFGKDDRFIWFAQRTGDWQYDAMMPIYQLAVYDRRTGDITTMSNRYGSAFRPTLSPDGKWLVYGTRHDAQTGLRIRDLRTGGERWLLYPVQRDDQEARATLDVLPGMAFTPDSEALIVSYGGGIWRVPVDGGEPTRIPFTVDVQLELAPLLEFEYPVDDGPTFDARQIRDAVPSPDGRRLAFTALNRLYVVDGPDAKPRRLTSSEVGEFAPVWAPDGRSIAYITWSDADGGHIWRVPANGGRPQQLTRVPALYRQLAWSPDGARIVALRSATRRPGGMSGGGPAEFIWIPATGGEATLIAPAAGRSSPHFTNDPDRIWAHSSAQGLVSFRWDGTDVRTHLQVTGRRGPSAPQPPRATRILMSPTGGQAVAQVVNDLYLVTVPEVGGPAPTISVADPDRAAFPARRLTTVGGHFPVWSRDGRSVHWSLGSSHFVYDVAAGETDERRIRVEIRRDRPEGAVVLRGARAITMRGNEIIEDADILIDGTRIAGIGPRGSLTVPADASIIDVSGTTIVPGFVDTHYHTLSLVNEIHTSQVWQYLATLAYGTTTTRDPQTGSADVLTYGDRVESGDLIGPRIYSTGPGLGRSEPVRSLDHAREVLRRYSEYYDTRTLKMYMAGNRRQRQWIAMAAAELGLMPTTEGGMDLGLNLTHMIDGYSGVEHNLPVMPLYDDVVTLLARSGTVNSPTLVVAYGGPLTINRLITTGNLHNDPKLRRFYPHEELDRRFRRRGSGGTGSYGVGGWFAEDEYTDHAHAKFIARVVDAGGRVAVGSHGEVQGLGFHWEMWILADGGLSPHEVLRAATMNGAEAIGLARDIGSLEAGKLADLVVLNADPLADIRNTKAIRYVMKNGRLYDADTLDEVWPRKRPRPPAPSDDPVPSRTEVR